MIMLLIQQTAAQSVELEPCMHQMHYYVESPQFHRWQQDRDVW